VSELFFVEFVEIFRQCLPASGLGPTMRRVFPSVYFLFRSVAAVKPVKRASTSQTFDSGNSGVVVEKVIVTVSDASAVSKVAEEGKVMVTVA